MPTDTRAVGRVTLGAALVLLGAMWMLGEAVGADLSAWWPLFVVVPGVALTVWGVMLHGGARTAAFVVGFQLIGVGGVLWVQSALDLWPTWAYAWALLWPGTVGAAIWIGGRLNGDPIEATRGRRAMNVGLIMFAVGFVFFEGLIGISGDAFPLSDLVVPLVLVGLGALLLVPGVRKRSRNPR